MTISDIIANSTRPFPSLEIVPPLKGVTREELIASVKPLMEFNPPFINVTCHRDEFEFRQESDGSFSRHIVRRRVSESAVCSTISDAFGVEVVPHLICGGNTADTIAAQLQDFKFLGFRNILALRGDSLLGEKRFTPEPGGYKYASELVGAIRKFAGESDADFCIGVAGYPEKHFEAPNMESDIDHLKCKVEAGADYIVTQMFFDNKAFYSFRDRCREAGITVPIIPGLKPLSNARQLEMIPEAFSIDIPQPLVKELSDYRDDADKAYRAGLEWCIAQCEDLLKHDVPAIHFYTMGRGANVCEILKRLF